jgi:hypothetical protein
MFCPMVCLHALELSRLDRAGIEQRIDGGIAAQVSSVSAPSFVRYRTRRRPPRRDDPHVEIILGHEDYFLVRSQRHRLRHRNPRLRCIDRAMA